MRGDGRMSRGGGGVRERRTRGGPARDQGEGRVKDGCSECMEAHACCWWDPCGVSLGMPLGLLVCRTYPRQCQGVVDPSPSSSPQELSARPRRQKLTDGVHTHGPALVPSTDTRDAGGGQSWLEWLDASMPAGNSCAHVRRGHASRT